MITAERLVKLTLEEIANAFATPIDTLLGSLPVGMLLQPFPVIVAGLAAAFIEAWFNLQRSLHQVPYLLAARLLVEQADLGNSTQVTTVRQAKTFAVQLVLGAIAEISGRGPPELLGLAPRATGVKGIRARFHKAEERQILGKHVSRLFSLIRTPSTLVIRAVQAIWGLALAGFGIGAVWVLYAIISKDWSEISLSQKHPRKKMRVRVNKRL